MKLAALYLVGALYQGIGRPVCECGGMERTLQRVKALHAPELAPFLTYYHAVHQAGWSFEAAREYASLIMPYKALLQQVALAEVCPENARYWADKLAQGVEPRSLEIPEKVRGVQPEAVHLVSALYAYPELAQCMDCLRPRIEAQLQSVQASLRNAPVSQTTLDFLRAWFHFFSRQLQRGYGWSYEIVECEARFNPMLRRFWGHILEVVSTEAAPATAEYWAAQLVEGYYATHR